MITKNGRAQVLKLMSGKAFKFADLFVVGASNAALTTDTTTLDLGWGTVPITGAYINDADGTVIFHATLNPGLAGDIYEVGLISQSADFISSGLPTSLIYGFDPSENWFAADGVEFEVVNSSTIGATNYKFVNSIVDQYLAKLVNGVNIKTYDTIKFRAISDAVTKVQILFKNDELNYIYKDLTLVNGMNTISNAMNTFTMVGTFSPMNVTEIRVVVKEVSNATNSIDFDAVLLSSNANGGLVARSTFTTPIYKRQGASMEVEFAVKLDD